MTMTDPIADMLTRIRNANVAFHDDVPMPSSKLKEAVAKILEREGYISGYEVDDQPGRPGRRLTIRMKYSSDRRRTISGLEARARARVCASTRRPTACRACSAAWVSRSSPPTWAADRP